MAGFDVDIQNIGELVNSGNKFGVAAVDLNSDLKSFSNRVEALTVTWDSTSKGEFVEIQQRFRRAFADLIGILGELGQRVVKVGDNARETEDQAVAAIRGGTSFG